MHSYQIPKWRTKRLNYILSRKSDMFLMYVKVPFYSVAIASIIVGLIFLPNFIQ